jgi:tetratricopeptide (TPR) repeat protein
MHQNLEPRWLAARHHEAMREFSQARAIYAEILHGDASQAFAWNRLSALSTAQGRPCEARDAALRGAEVAITNRRWKVLPWLTQQLLMLDERTAVVGAITRCDWNAPQVLAQSAVLCQQLWLADAHQAGLDITDHALRLAPTSHLLHYVRANLLRHLGRSAEATAAFERCIEIAPAFADAHWGLANHEKSEPVGVRVARVSRAQQAAHKVMQRAMLGYALFKEFDDAGQTDVAWAALSDAAALMRQKLPYRQPHHAQAMKALRDFNFDDAHAGSAAAITADQRRPIFIVGLPRSGTTVLDRILGNHSRVVSGGELNAFAMAMALTMDRPWNQPPTAAQIGAAAGLDFAEVGARYLDRTRDLYGGSDCLVDKNPLNVFHAGFIARALPQAKIFCLLRDPMDVCFSNFKELFPGGGYEYSYDLGELASYWLDFRALVDHWSRTLPNQFMVVNYENMVTDPERNASKALNFCGLSLEPGCADITRNTAPVSTASSSQVRRPIHSAGIGAWRRYEQQLAPLAKALGGAG